MLPRPSKRKLAASAGPASKRCKPSKTASHGGKSRSSVSRKRLIDAGQLSWTSMGDQFDGVEVITGVDVVKTGDKVQFLVKDESSTRNHLAGKGEGQNESIVEKSGDSITEGQNDTLPDADSHRSSKEVSSDPPPPKKSKQVVKGKREQSRRSPRKDKDSEVSASMTAVKNPATPQENTFGVLAHIAEADQQESADLPAWVALNLSPRILPGIAKLGFNNPTSIQKMVIPEIVAGADVIGKAQTGSGKTLAFGIPIVEKWLELHHRKEAANIANIANEKTDGPLALVLSPTRELAKQIGDHLTSLCKGLAAAPRICVVMGGLSVQKQQRQLAKADIVVGTPGRLWEVMDGDMTLQKSMTRIAFLVVDEADRLFKTGQFKEAEDIIGVLDKKDLETDGQTAEEVLTPRQTLVFSATFDKDLQTKLAGKGRPGARAEAEDKTAYLMKCLKFRHEPKFLDANPATKLADKLREGLIECGAMEKDLYLYAILVLNPGRRTLVFTNSISAVRRLTPFLSNLNLKVLPLHSQMAQKARMRSVERFAESPGSILVSTDVAARGLDIHQIDQVVHYHVPRAADTYIHRSGRTARGDQSGISVLLCSPEEVLPTRRLAAKVHAEQSHNGAQRQHVIQSLPIDRKVAARLRPRVELSKRIADAVLAKEKATGTEAWLKTAAEDLGVEYDADDFDDVGRGGRGGGRMRKEKAARGLTKAEMGALRMQLREELSRMVNLGVSERYITGGRIDVAALLREREAGASGMFLGGENLGLGL